MGAKRQSGFTIIEVTMFLAISGLMAVLLLGGWSTMINTQRYKDSNRTLQSFLQQQYNLVYNVENGRGSDLSCVDSVVTENNGSDTEKRGQTACSIMGRYVLINENGNARVSSIVGDDPGDALFNSDLEALIGWQPNRVSQQLGLSDNELTIPWGAQIVRPSDNQPRSIAIAVIRSPLTGIVHTYSVDVADSSNPPDVASMLNSDYEEIDQNMCLDPGGFVVGGRMGVQIRRFASTQDSVQILPDGDGVC